MGLRAIIFIQDFVCVCVCWWEVTLLSHNLEIYCMMNRADCYINSELELESNFVRKKSKISHIFFFTL